MTRPTHSTSVVRPAPRPGFAFTEILFAVMILALGFIMIAAMFPVTIRQTQSTMEEATAANVAKGAMDYLQGIASEDFFPVTHPPATPKSNNIKIGDPAEVVSLPSVYYTNPRNLLPTQMPKAWGDSTKGNVAPAYFAVRGNMIDPKNPRIAWIPMYRRVFGSPFAQVFILVVQSRNQEQYLAAADTTGQFPARNYSDFDVPANGTYATLDPRRIAVGVEWGDKSPWFHKGGIVTIDPQSKDKDVAAPGAYLIIAADPNDDNLANPPRKKGTAIGRVYQLGNAVDEAAGVWELAPGSDMIRTNTDQTKVGVGDDYDCPPVFPPDDKKTTFAYIVGRGYTNPTNAAEGYSGPAQDIGVYTGFIHIPTPQPTN